MKITERGMMRMQCAKLFNENHHQINCIDYNSEGTAMITSSNDDSIVVYNLQSGTRDKGVQVNSKKYGVGLIRYTHANSTALHTSTKVDDTVRYLSLHDNKYIRYFPGHNKTVTCLSMSPVDDMFLSGSMDKTIRLWDLKSQNCQGLMQVQGRAIAAFDPEGIIFAAGIGNDSLKLYDLRSFDKGPFTTFKIESQSKNVEWTGLEFSTCGKMILINTNSNELKLVDAFNGSVKHVLSDHRNDKKEPLEATFTPDSQFVWCGSSDGRLFCWSTETGRKVVDLPTDHGGCVRITKWNPHYYMMAAACSKLSYWICAEDDN